MCIANYLGTYTSQLLSSLITCVITKLLIYIKAKIVQNRLLRRFLYNRKVEGLIYMLITTQDIPENYVITETYGIVMGNTVRARHVGSDIIAGIRNLIGGEVTGYTKLLTESRNEALKRLTQEAETLGANAIVTLRFTTSNIMGGMTEILAYGTAVKIEKS